MIIYSNKFSSLLFFSLSIYSLWYSVSLFNYGPEIYSAAGIIADVSWNTPATFWPNYLFYFDSPIFIQIIFGIQICMSLFLLRKSVRPIGLFGLYIIGSWLYNRNIYTHSPELHYIHWIYLSLFVSLVLVPQTNKGLRLPTIFFGSSWFLLGAGYSFAAWSRRFSTNWLNGKALPYLLQTDAGLPSNDFLISIIPNWSWTPLSYFIFGLEALGVILILIPVVRNYFWFLMVLMHIGALFTFSFWQISLGMIIFHLFITPNVYRQKIENLITGVKFPFDLFKSAN